MGMGNMLVLSQATGYSLIFIMAFFIFIPLAVNKTDFGENCLLYARGEWHRNNGSSEPELEITKWGNGDSCNFPIFVAVASLPAALAYCAILSVDLFKKTEPSWLSAFICLLVTLCGWLLSLIAACTVTVGYNVWCELMEEETMECSLAQTQAEAGYIKVPDSINISHFAAQFGIAKFGLWVSWVAWSVLSVLAAIQLYKYHQNESIFVSIRRERERLIQRSQASEAV